MSTLSECRAWGLEETLCSAAIDNARAIAARAAPKTETMFQCETRSQIALKIQLGALRPGPPFVSSQPQNPAKLDISNLRQIDATVALPKKFGLTSAFVRA